MCDLAHGLLLCSTNCTSGMSCGPWTPFVMTICVVHGNEAHTAKPHMILVLVKGTMLLCDVHIVRDTP